MLHTTPRSMMYRDRVSVGGCPVLNGVDSREPLDADPKGVTQSLWVQRVIVLSIPWAISTRTFKALLSFRMPARTFWLTAILAPGFLTIVVALLLLRMTATRRNKRWLAAACRETFVAFGVDKAIGADRANQASLVGETSTLPKGGKGWS
jgi:hypothetical protein